MRISVNSVLLFTHYELNTQHSGKEVYKMGLKEKRKERKIKQADMANIFNLGYRTYQNYENGKSYPTMTQAAEFARYFNCTIGELFDLKEGNNEDYDNCENKVIYLYRKMSERDKRLFIAIGENMVKL